MRPGRLAVAALAAAITIAALPTGIDSLAAEPTAFVSWWAATGTAGATIGVLQLVAVGGFAYISAIATAVTIADGLRLAGARRFVMRFATPRLRQALAIGVLAGAVSLPSPVLAETTAITVTDIGAVTATPEPTPAVFALTDLGPAAAAHVESAVVAVPTSDDAVPQLSTGVADGFRPPSAATVADSWLVEDGDNLWTIAEATLDDAGQETTEPEIVRYWLALIEANQNVVADADLIYPGQVLNLPPVATAGS